MAIDHNQAFISRCRCGDVMLETSGRPIIACACYCTSCRTAGERLQSRAGAPAILEPDGGTEFVLFRKDRVRFLGGTERLREFRLTPTAKTRRVIAACCNTPMFLEFQNGHWLSLYRQRMPVAAQPRLELRTMTRDRLPGVEFQDTLPSYATQSVGFMFRLLTAWVAMRFRSPSIDFVNGSLDEQAH
jgi:hypothetical protein